MAGSRGMMLAAMVCSIVALCLSVVSVSRTSSRDASNEVAEQVYQRILGEIRTEIQPVYEDFGIRMDEAGSFRELLKPFLNVQPDVSESDGIEKERPAPQGS